LAVSIAAAEGEALMTRKYLDATIDELTFRRSKRASVDSWGGKTLDT
jgi:hypothetical protein